MNEITEGKCSICEKKATTRCSSCKNSFYCGKEHQKKDWPNHKLTCKAYEECIEYSELGRYLVASKDLNPGDLVMSETPLVWGPAAHTEDRICVGCGIRNALCRCPGCGWPACVIACPGLTNKNIHGEECAILASARLLPRCDYLLILRILLLKRKNTKRWKAIEKLQSHEDRRGPGTDAYEETEKVIEYLEPIIKIDPTIKEVLPEICGIIDVNALDTIPPDGSMGIYENACLLEHNCVANTRHTFTIDDEGRPRINVIAATLIKKGEHLSTSYTHVMWATRSRRDHLLATKYFACICSRCKDPTELGSHLSTIKCPCEKGFVTPKNSLDNETEWNCNLCPGILTSQEVDALIDRLGEEVNAAMAVASKEILSDLLYRLSVLLHPCHQHCITVGHTLMQLLPPEDEKKIELCKRMLDTIKIIDPYNARLPVYQAIALRELSKCPNQDKKSLLKKASEVLKYEPNDSPGGQYLKIVLSEIE